MPMTAASQMNSGQPSTQEHSGSQTKHYRHLMIMSAIHLPVMFAVMYTMVDSFADVFANLNQVYMAGMMVAPMTFLMILSMKHMYPDQKKNLLVYIGSAVFFVALLIFMRDQTFIGDKQFLRSMIPHHSGAVLMCNEAKVSDPEIQSLCAKIVESQKEEIEQMKSILSRLE